MKEYYHYTTQKNVPSICKTGLSENVDFYTTDKYFTASEAGARLGVMAHNIDCVLLFADDGNFRPAKPPIVDGTNRFIGGGTAFIHPQKKKPIAVRKIFEPTWSPFK